MTRILSTCVALVMAASPVLAQTTAANVIGDSGNPAYPIEVVGANGVRYFCRDDGETDTGAPLWACIRPGRGSALDGGGAGIAAAAAIGLGLIALVAADDT